MKVVTEIRIGHRNKRNFPVKVRHKPTTPERIVVEMAASQKWGLPNPLGLSAGHDGEGWRVNGYDSRGRWRDEPAEVVTA